MKKFVARALVFALLMALIPPAYAAQSGYTPAPQTAYAEFFVEKSEGQQWFLNEVERLLNAEQKTLDTVESASDFRHIQSLGLRDRGIVGKIPAAIGELAELRYLFLSGNQLSGDIPAELFALPKLENVDLSGNAYGGAIPAGFGTMPSLTTLELKNNAYSGAVPETILHNTKIATLNLLGNKLSGNTLADFTGMTGLKYLNVSQNDVSGPIPDLGALTELLSLSAWECGLTGEIPETLYALDKLQVLDLSGNRLSGGVSASVSGLSEIRYLALDNNQLRGTLPDAFTMEKLEAVHLEHNYLRGMAPATLKARADAGAEVFLNDNYMTGAALKEMANNSGNFTDGASSGQYQLTSSKGTVRLSWDGTVDLYALLQNKALASGLAAKAVLLPEEYTAACGSGKVALTQDSSGIYARALEDIKASEDITVTISIRDNDGSGYSTVKFAVTTEALNGSGSGGGSNGGGSATNSGGVISGGGRVSAAPIASAVHIPYINGYPDGTFGPEDSLTREQAAKLLVDAMGQPTVVPMLPTFSDVEADRWSYAWVEAAAQEGYVTGFEGRFDPERSITRAELAAILSRAAAKLALIRAERAVSFTDVPESEWYAAPVRQAARYGLINGYEDGTFHPDATVTRAEAVTMVNRLLGRTPETSAQLKTLACPFPDVDREHWAYWQIMEAAMRHEH